MTGSRSKRTPPVRWAKAIADAASPVFLLDARRRLVLFNRGCEAETGWPAEELLGQICDFATEADSHSGEAMLAACAAPPEVWLGRDVELPCVLPHRDAAARPMRVCFHPLIDAGGKVQLVWGRFLPALEASPVPIPPALALHAELAALRHKIRGRYRESSVVAQSLPMRRVLAQLLQASQGTHCVLLIGEPGTGREHLARVLHSRGPQAALSFVPVDCSRTDSGELKRLIRQMRDDQRELEALRAGTLYLKDIAAAQRDVQERLAEWLSAGSGGPRVVASSEIDLEPLVAEDRFLRELYYELTTATIVLPPLRDRPEDVPLLAQHFLEGANRGSSKQLSGFAAETLEHLQRYRWPGNSGELARVIQSAAGTAAGPQIQLADLPSSFRLGEDAQSLPPSRENRLPLDEVLAQTERAEIEAALSDCRGNLSRTAELLGWSRPKLYRRLEALGLLPDDAK